jgi:hypothetical protein
MNVANALYNTFFTTLSPERLFSYNDGKLRSACLYWKNLECAIRPIEANHIVETSIPTINYYSSNSRYLWLTTL